MNMVGTIRWLGNGPGEFARKSIIRHLLNWSCHLRFVEAVHKQTQLARAAMNRTTKRLV